MNRITFRLFAGSFGMKTYAAWPIWSGSTMQQVSYQPMPKKQAVKLYHRARDFDRQTRQPGQHGGAIGPTALKVLETLLFDFLNFRTGQLDPAQETIAKRANLCVRSVRSGLKRLRELGILTWLRRCAERRDADRYVLAQLSNAYAVLPSSHWRGYTEPPAPPAVHPDTWGACPPLPGVIDQAIIDRKHGGTLRSMVSVLDSDPRDELARALANLGRAVATRKS